MNILSTPPKPVHRGRKNTCSKSRPIPVQSVRKRYVVREKDSHLPVKNVKLRSYAKKKEIPLVVTGMLYFAVFVVITGVTQSLSSLAGHTLVEKTRREGLRAREKASEIKLEVGVLRKKVEELTSITSVERWAAAHGYVQDYQPTTPPNTQNMLVHRMSRETDYDHFIPKVYGTITR